MFHLTQLFLREGGSARAGWAGAFPAGVPGLRGGLFRLRLRFGGGLRRVDLLRRGAGGGVLGLPGGAERSAGSASVGAQADRARSNAAARSSTGNCFILCFMLYPHFYVAIVVPGGTHESMGPAQSAVLSAKLETTCQAIHPVFHIFRCQI